MNPDPVREPSRFADNSERTAERHTHARRPIRADHGSGRDREVVPVAPVDPVRRPTAVDDAVNGRPDGQERTAPEHGRAVAVAARVLDAVSDMSHSPTI